MYTFFHVRVLMWGAINDLREWFHLLVSFILLNYLSSISTLTLNIIATSSTQTGAQWLSAWLETKGPRDRASQASLPCGPWARHIYPSLVLLQPRKTRPCLTERLLMGRKESNQTNKQTCQMYTFFHEGFDVGCHFWFESVVSASCLFHSS